MIRPFTCICMLLAGGSGLYLYQTKHRSQMLDREIADTVHQTLAARERSGVLRAEWTLLNDPQRLGDLAARFLSLKSTQPGQFTSLAELDKRLPPAGTPTDPGRTTDEPTDDAGVPLAAAAPAAPGTPGTAKAGTPAAAGGTSGVMAVATTAAPAPQASPAAPVAGPAAQPVATKPVATAAAAPPHPATARTARATERMAERAAERRTARETASGYGRATPAGAPVPVVTNVSTPARPAPAYRPPAYSAAAYGQPAPVTGSALGMARIMTPQSGGYAPYGN